MVKGGILKQGKKIDYSNTVGKNNFKANNLIHLNFIQNEKNLIIILIIIF